MATTTTTTQICAGINGVECTLCAYTQCNLCKVHMLQLLMQSEVEQLQCQNVVGQDQDQDEDVPPIGEPMPLREPAPPQIQHHPTKVEKPKKDKVEKPKKDKVEKPKKPKVKKDPNRIKKPMGPYMCFCNEMRSPVKQANPTMSTKDPTKEMGRLWTEIKTDGEKTAPYIKLAEEDKLRYEQQQQQALLKGGVTTTDEVTSEPISEDATTAFQATCSSEDESCN